MARNNKPESILLADIGGTNVRFAVLSGGMLGHIDHMAAADYNQFSDALAAFLARRAVRSRIRHAIFGVAGVVEGGHCALTNNPWVIDAKELCARFDFVQVHLINDFEAIAWSLPHLAPNQVRMIGGRAPKLDAPKVVLGPGTGLGVAAYVPAGQSGFVIRSEGGHATVPSSSLREDAIIEKLRQSFGHVSAERVLSGGGLENLYRSIALLDSSTVPERNAAEITQAAIAGSCATSRAALDTFCALLGVVAGNFALTFGAQGGIFVAGGIAPHIRDYLPRSQFRSHFEAKGRMSRYVQAIPIYLILHDYPAFIGLQSLAEEQA